MPRFNTISISGYHMQEAGATRRSSSPIHLLMVEYIRTAIGRTEYRRFRTQTVVLLGHRHEFLHGNRKDACRATCGRRSLRVLAEQSKSSMLRTHCQTSGWSLTEQDPYNNIVRTTIGRWPPYLAVRKAFTRMLSTRRLRYPRFRGRIARNAQLVLQEETGMTSQVVETLGVAPT